ncbi:MAG: hypothetical protein ACHQ1H_00205 [Nitrososphaerales archaeon]
MTTEDWNDKKLHLVIQYHKPMLPDFFSYWQTFVDLGVKDIAKQKLFESMGRREILEEEFEQIEDSFWKIDFQNSQREIKWLFAVSREPSLKQKYSAEINKMKKLFLGQKEMLEKYEKSLSS